MGEGWGCACEGPGGGCVMVLGVYGHWCLLDLAPVVLCRATDGQSGRSIARRVPGQG